MIENFYRSVDAGDADKIRAARAKKLSVVADISVRIRNAMELSCITDGDNPTRVLDAECDDICVASSPEMAELIRDALSGYAEVCELLGLPDPY